MSPHMDDGAVVGCLFFDVDLFIGFILFFGHSSFPDHLGSARLSPTLFSGLRNSPNFFDGPSHMPLMEKRPLVLLDQ